MKPTTVINASIWTQRYEAVRQHVLSPGQILTANPLGLVLLLKQGVAGWMRLWLEGLSDALPALNTAPAPLCPPTPIWQQQLTLLLGQMTFGHFCV